MYTHVYNSPCVLCMNACMNVIWTCIQNVFVIHMNLLCYGLAALLKSNIFGYTQTHNLYILRTYMHDSHRVVLLYLLFRKYKLNCLKLSLCLTIRLIGCRALYFARKKIIIKIKQKKIVLNSLKYIFI